MDRSVSCSQSKDENKKCNDDTTDGSFAHALGCAPPLASASLGFPVFSGRRGSSDFIAADGANCWPWGQKTRTSHLLLYSQQLQAGIEGNLGRRQSPQISPSQDRFPTIGASAQLTHGGIS